MRVGDPSVRFGIGKNEENINGDSWREKESDQLTTQDGRKRRYFQTSKFQYEVHVLKARSIRYSCPCAIEYELWVWLDPTPRACLICPSTFGGMILWDETRQRISVSAVNYSVDEHRSTQRKERERKGKRPVERVSAVSSPRGG